MDKSMAHPFFDSRRMIDTISLIIAFKTIGNPKMYFCCLKMSVKKKKKKFYFAKQIKITKQSKQ